MHEETEVTVVMKNVLCYTVLAFVEDRALCGLSYEGEVTKYQSEVRQRQYKNKIPIIYNVDCQGHLRGPLSFRFLVSPTLSLTVIDRHGIISTAAH
jgi:hypothetical protein